MNRTETYVLARLERALDDHLTTSARAYPGDVLPQRRPTSRGSQREHEA